MHGDTETILSIRDNGYRHIKGNPNYNGFNKVKVLFLWPGRKDGSDVWEIRSSLCNSQFNTSENENIF